MLKKLAYSIPEVCEATTASRSFVYAEIAAGHLRATKLGRRTVILSEHLDAWLSSKSAATSPSNAS